MKKRMRTLMSLVLVIMLVASMSAPAMAMTEKGDGNMKPYTYNYTVSCNATNGVATISISPRTTYVKARAVNTLYDEVNKISGTSDGEETAFANAYATADNYIRRTLSGTQYLFVSEIRKTTGQFWVNGENVVPGVNAYPG